MKITQFYQTNNYTVFCEHMKVMLQINIKITKKKYKKISQIVSILQQKWNDPQWKSW